MKEIIEIITEQIPNWILLYNIIQNIIELATIPMINIPFGVTFGIWLYKKLKRKKRF